MIREIFSQTQQAVRWVTDLNDAINDIAIVTGKTGDQITRVTEQAIKGSRELRVAARDYAEGALIFYQQGLNDEEVTRRNEITIKAAKAAGQSIEQMSQQLTAVWNTYGMIGEQQERAASIGAKMAAQTAVDFKDIAEAMQIAAAPASQMGVAYESLAAIIATVGDTTQQSASTIGNAYKTIFSRMQQLKISGTDGEVTFKAMSQQLAAMGIALEDSSGKLLSIDKVIEQVGKKWDTWTNKQQLAVAELVGGTRQYGQFLALMQNYDKYLANLRSAQSEGVETLNTQYTQAIESIESKAENAAEAWHRAFANAFDADQIKTFYEASENLANVVGVIVEGFGGIPGALALSAVILRQRILPTAKQAGSFMRGLIESTTTEGRQRSIHRDYSEMRQRYSQSRRDNILAKQAGTISSRDFQLTKENLDYQEKMASFDEQVAIVNEQISTELSKANGERKIGLELAKEQLTTDRQIYTQNLQNLQSSSQSQTSRDIKTMLSRREYGNFGNKLGRLQQFGQMAAKYGAKQMDLEEFKQAAIGTVYTQLGVFGNHDLVKTISSANTTWEMQDAIALLMQKLEDTFTKETGELGEHTQERILQTFRKINEVVETGVHAKEMDPNNRLPGEETSSGKNINWQKGIDATTTGIFAVTETSNAINTLADSSATLTEKLGGATGALSSLGMMAVMVGPQFAVLAGVIGLLIEGAKLASTWKEREIQKMQDEINTTNDYVKAYQEAQELEKQAGTPAERAKAINDQAEAMRNLQDQLKLTGEEYDRIFANGKVNIEEINKLLEEQSLEIEKKRAENAKQNVNKEIQRSILDPLFTQYGYTGGFEELQGLKGQDLKNYLIQNGGYDEETGRKLASDMTNRELDELAQRIERLGISAELVNDTIDALNEDSGIFGSIDSLSQLEEQRESIISNGGKVDYDAYAEALMRLGSQYEFATEEVKEFNNALLAGNNKGLSGAERAFLQTKEAALKLSIAVGEGSKKFKLNGDSVEAQAKQVAKALKLDAESAANVAIADQRLNRGLKTLKENLADWKSTIQSGIITNQDYADTIVAITDVIGDLINAKEGFELPETFDLAKNLNLIEQAATGSESAILALGGAITKAEIAASELNYAIAPNLSEFENFSAEELIDHFERIQWAAQNTVDAIQDAFAGLSPGDELQGNIGAWVETLNEYARMTGMSVDDMNHLLSQIGVQANVVAANVPLETEVPEYEEHSQIVGYEYNTWSRTVGNRGETESGVEKSPIIRRYTKTIGTHKVQGTTQVANITSGPDGKPPSITYVGKPAGASPIASRPKGSGGGGGGGGGGKGSEFKPKNAKSQANSGKLSERYTNTQSRIDNVSRSIQRLSDAEADAWGGKAYRNLQGINTLLGKQAEYLQLIQAEATGYLQKDQEALGGLLSKNGILAADYNSSGFVQNRQTIIDELEAQRFALASEVDRLNTLYDANGVVDEALDAQIEEATQKMDKWNEYSKEVISAIDQVDETAQKVQDTMNERVEQIREWMSNQVKMAQIKLDLKLQISDTEIRQLEHLIDLWGDLGTEIGRTWKNMRDAAGYTSNKAWSYVENANRMNQLLNIASPTSEYRLQYEAMFGADAWQKYIAGHGGHPQEVIDQLSNAIESAQQEMWNAQQKFREMLQEWIKLFQMYMDKFDKISSRIAQSNATLDMFVSILNATGRNYTAAGARSMANISAARYSNARGNVLVQRGRYQLARNAFGIASNEMDIFQSTYGSDVNTYSEAELIRYQQLRSDIEETQKVMDEALTAVKNGISEMASAMTEALESSTTAISTALFDTIGGAFADNSQAVELFGVRKEVDDYFLDKLTKDYELSKLSNEITAYLEDNDISNVERYSDLLDEINEAAQEGVDINQTDLEILQKKFELEQAVDAYEEQQRFKNTMRLARDASGNWSYVYSGDQNTAQSQQELQQRIKDNTYEIAKLQQDAAEAAEEAWIQTWSKIYELEQERGTARYKQDEEYRAYIDSMINLETQKLERYKDEIVKRYDAIDLRFEDSSLAWVMNTDGSLTEMQALHDHHLDYLIQFGDDVEANADEIIDSFQEDVTDVTEGIEELEGDYTDLESLIDEKTSDMIDENQGLADEIQDMVDEGTDALQSLAEEMRISADSMIADLNALEEEIRRLLELLQELRGEQVKDIEAAELGFDASKDYAAVIENTARQIVLDNPGITMDEAVARAKAKLEEDGILQQRYNKMSSNELLELGHGSVVGAGYSSQRAAEEADQLIRLGVGLAWAGAGPLSEQDLSEAAQAYLKIHSSGTGNYFKRPGITTVAENEPEIILNPEDTRNILAAVKFVRSTINSGLAQTTSMGLGIASRNASIGGIGGMGLTVQTPVQQGVQIDANFPNVSVASEVENALDMLILQAAQYAGNRE